MSRRAPRRVPREDGRRSRAAFCASESPSPSSCMALPSVQCVGRRQPQIPGLGDQAPPRTVLGPWLAEAPLHQGAWQAHADPAESLRGAPDPRSPRRSQPLAGRRAVTLQGRRSAGRGLAPRVPSGGVPGTSAAASQADVDRSPAGRPLPAPRLRAAGGNVTPGPCVVSGPGGRGRWGLGACARGASSALLPRWACGFGAVSAEAGLLEPCPWPSLRPCRRQARLLRPARWAPRSVHPRQREEAAWPLRSPLAARARELPGP